MTKTFRELIRQRANDGVVFEVPEPKWGDPKLEEVLYATIDVLGDRINYLEERVRKLESSRMSDHVIDDAPHAAYADGGKL